MSACVEDDLVRQLGEMVRRPPTPETRDRVAKAQLDWFTAGWSAAALPAAHTLYGLARVSCPGPGPSPVFGQAGLQPLAAAFANAGISHLREIDDAHRAAMLHPGVVSLAPVLALAGAQTPGQPVTQQRVLAAILAGYEVSLRVGEALGAAHAARFHATATAGSVGAAAAAGVLLGLPEAQLHHALGIAATQAAGLWQLVDDGAHEAKSLHPAFAVRNGMYAAWAAQAGLPGARAFVTGARGLHALLSGDGPLHALTVGAGGPPRIHTVTIKAWPCCAQLFTPLDAALALREAHALVADDIAAVEVVIFPHALKIAGVDWPTRPAETCFSLRYVLATLLLKGRLGIDDTETPDLQDPALLALAQRITVRTDDEFQRVFPLRRRSRVTLTLKDGRQLSALRELRRGDPELPFEWPALLARMRAFAPAMDDAAAARVQAWCTRVLEPQFDGQACMPPADLFV